MTARRRTLHALLIATVVATPTALTTSTPLTAHAAGRPADAATVAPPRTAPVIRATSAGPAGPPVRVEGRQLIDARGNASPYIADTAWFLVERLTREEVAQYLDARRRQGFTAIQVPAVMGGGNYSMHGGKNAYGDTPWWGDAGSPAVTGGSFPWDGNQYDYWDHYAYVVGAIRDRGMTPVVLPAWSKNHAGHTLTTGNARSYGAFLAGLTRGTPIVWMLGGDDTNPQTAIWDGVKAGLRSVAPNDLITYHPAGVKSSLEQYPATDFATVQTGHCQPPKNGYASLVADTAAKTRGPVIDSEPLYEDHPWCWDTRQGYSTPDQVRTHLYWAAFASGGAGVTYGHHTMWQFIGGANARPINNPRGDWRSALYSPVAQQIRHLGTALTTRAARGRVADDSVITADRGSGWSRKVGMRSADGSYVMAYLPRGGTARLDAGKLSGWGFRATWLSPRDGSTRDGGWFHRGNLAPTAPDDRDWVLVVDVVNR